MGEGGSQRVVRDAEEETGYCEQGCDAERSEEDRGEVVGQENGSVDRKAHYILNWELVSAGGKEEEPEEKGCFREGKRDE